MFVTLSIGSNYNPQDNISTALDSLLLQVHDLKLSSVFESKAANNKPVANYLNMAVGFDTDQSLPELQAWLKAIETKHKRVRDDAGGQVTLDLDLLTYDNKNGQFDNCILPRPEILEQAYVLWPLSQVAPKLKDPASGIRYAEHWKNFSGDKSNIWPVNFEWHERVLSRR